MSIRLAADIGGTFTDVVLDVDGALHTTKVLTTYDDPARGVMQGVAQVMGVAGVQPGAVHLILHGTTLATNALIERRGARTALLTTAGHRDVLEMALENRFEQYDVNVRRPEPLVPRHLRLPIRERLAADGEVLIPLDEHDVLQAAEQLAAAQVESVAVGFLHAYADPIHENRVAEMLTARLPEVSVTTSSAVCPEVREYERFSTAVANAYVKPLMSRYLDSLQAQLASIGMRAPILLMSSGGGLTTLEAAKAFPIRLVESGPAGGAQLAAAYARHNAWQQVLSFDMGGTTAKICLIDDGVPQLSRSFEIDRVYRFKKGSGLPVRIPVVEMVEIGAGGGSLAQVDRLDRIAVGPESAGSEPGPACYALGGERPAVTDADLLLGKLRAETFAGGTMTLDSGQAESALQRAVAEPLGLSTDDAAWGVSETVDENMALAARAHASEWGRALEDRTMIAFGGAAPLHAANLAAKLRMSRVVVPPHAGVGSAVGFLLAPVSFEVVRSEHVDLRDLNAGDVTALLDHMRHEARAVVADAAGDAALQESVRAYMRYVGQGFEVAVDVPAGGGDIAKALRDAFEAAYRQLYGQVIPGQPVEVLSWTLSLATAASQPMQAVASPEQGEGETPRAQMYDGRQWCAAPVYQRASLLPGSRHPGPALVEEVQTTTVVPDGWEFHADSSGQLVLEVRR